MIKSFLFKKHYCRKIQSILVDYLLDGLSQERKKEIKAHLEKCISCSEKLENLKKVYFILEKLPDVKPETNLYEEICPQINGIFVKKPFYLFRLVPAGILIVILGLFLVFTLHHREKLKEQVVLVEKEKSIAKKEKVKDKTIPQEHKVVVKKKPILIAEKEKKKVIVSAVEQKGTNISLMEEIGGEKEEIEEKEMSEVKEEEALPEEEIVIDLPPAETEEQIPLQKEEVKKVEEVPKEEPLSQAKFKKISKEEKISTKERKVNAIWSMPTKSPAVSPLDKVPSDKKGIVMPVLGGNVGVTYQQMRTPTSVQKKWTFARNANLTWQKPISKTRSISVGIIRNEQDTLNAKNRGLAGNISYSNSFLTLTANKNFQETKNQLPEGGNSISKQDTFSINLALSKIKSLPLNLTYNTTERVNLQNNSLTAKNTSNSFTLSTQTTLFNKITTAINYSHSETEDMLNKNRTKSNNTGLTLTYPVFRFLNLNFGLQKTESENLPQNSSAASTTKGINTTLGLTSNINQDIGLSLNLSQASNETITHSDTIKTKPTNISGSLNYKISNQLNLVTSYSASKANQAPSMQTIASSLTFTPSTKFLLGTTVLNLQNTLSKDKDGKPQSKNYQTGITTLIPVAKNLDIRTGFNLSENNSFSSAQSQKTENATFNLNINNKLGNFTHSSSINIAKTDTTSGSSHTNNYNYNLSYPHTFKIKRKELPANISFSNTLSLIKPQNTKNLTQTYTTSFQYPLSDSLSMTFNTSLTQNRQSANGTSKSKNSTLNNNLTLAFKSNKIPLNATLGANLVNSSQDISNFTFSLLYPVANKINLDLNFSHSKTKSGEKTTPTSNLTTGVSYQF